jgi:hypothetical protein
VFKQIGLHTCPNDPCLFRYLYEDSVCFLLQYVDDTLISGEPKAIAQIQKEIKRYMQCKFEKPKDFFGLDITHTQKGETTLSMESFTTKMKDVLKLQDNIFGEVLTPGRTDKKISRTNEHEPNDNYRSYVGTLNWLSMGLRFDIAFITKELSRVLDKPTPIANEIVNRALIFTLTSDSSIPS